MMEIVKNEVVRSGLVIFLFGSVNLVARVMRYLVSSLAKVASNAKIKVSVHIKVK
jgi:hypothetical protein